ncbi:MAG: hypothetical protein NTW32_22465 [Chloroflexi bacterium]|nr:hypothetical protein [Chloroflexota bacterium]
MKTDQYTFELSEYEYDVLKNNSMISDICSQLNSATKGKEGIDLSMTLAELTELIGFVAAEANHARKKREREDLNSICDYLEALEFDIIRHR